MDYGEAKKVVVSCNESSVDDWVVSYYTLQGGLVVVGEWG